MQVTKDSHSRLKVVPTTIPIGGPLGQQIRKTSMDSQVLVTRNLLIPDIDQNLKVVSRKKLSSFNGSASTTPRTKSITPYKSGSVLPGSYERDRLSSFGGEGIVKEDLKIEVPTDTQEVPGSETISPVKIAYSRNTPHVFDGFTEFDRMRDTELDNGDMSSTKIHSQHNQIDLMGTMDRRDDSTLFLNQNTSMITATRVFVTNPQRDRMEYDLSEMNRVERDTSLEKLPEVSKAITREEE